MTTDDPIEAARLDAIKTICRTEDHRWLDVSTYGDDLARDMCGRGCGAVRHRLHPGQKPTPAELAALMPANGRATVTDLAVIVEDDDA